MIAAGGLGSLLRKKYHPPTASAASSTTRAPTPIRIFVSSLIHPPRSESHHATGCIRTTGVRGSTSHARFMRVSVITLQWTAGSSCSARPRLPPPPPPALRSGSTSCTGAELHVPTLEPSPLSSTPATTPRLVPADPLHAEWVAEENAKPGTTSWQITGPAEGDAMEGYASSVSAVQGDTVSLYVSTAARSLHVEAYRMGWYGGAGGRLVWTSDDIPGERGRPRQPSRPVSTSSRQAGNRRSGSPSTRRGRPGATS